MNPEQPLLTSLTNLGTHLIRDKAAPNSAVGRGVAAYAGKLAGILGHLVSHGLRAGCAFGAANSVERPTGYATPEVARLLGHSRRALEKCVTDRYIGSSIYVHWSNRVKQSPPTAAFGSQIAEQRYRSPKMSTTLVTQRTGSHCSHFCTSSVW